MLSSLRKKLLPQFSRYLNRRPVTTAYQKALEKHPILVQAFQAGILMGAGDFIAQTVLEKNEIANVDYLRTAKFFGIGFCVAGPGLRKWYGFLDTAITSKRPVVRTVQKVFVDQIIMAPFFLGALVVIVGLTQDPDIQKVKTKLQTDYFDILKTNYYVWPWVQLINFRFVPLNYQVLLTQTVAVMWNIYFSWRTNLNERNLKAKREHTLRSSTEATAHDNQIAS